MQKKKVVTGLVFFIVSILLLYILDFLNGVIIRRCDSDKFWWMASLKKQKYDYAFLGASRVYTMIETDKVDSAWNKHGINLALDAANMMEQYIIIRKFLENQNTIKDLFFGIDFTVMDQNFNNDRIWCFLPYIHEDKYIYNEIRDNFGAKKAFSWKYIPYFNYARYNSKLGLFPMANSLFKWVPNPYKKNGDIVRPYTKVIDTAALELKFKKAPISVDPQSINYLQKIGAVCQKHHIRLHIFIAPVYYRRFQEVPNAEYNTEHYIIPEAAKLNADFHDFSASPISKIAYFYNDPVHMNVNGQKVFTQEIGQYYNSIMNY